MTLTKHTTSAWSWKVFLAVFFLAMAGTVIWQRQYPIAKIRLKGELLGVLVADTPARQFRGLGGRDALAPYDGMLFVFGESDRHAFVMRDMRFSIDIVWLANGSVVDIAPDVPLDVAKEKDLRRYTPRANANVVLELPAGWAERHHLAIGDASIVVDE